ncbi:MAG: M48 family metallopeptidase [Planctomycetota bacterium]
MNRLLLLAAFWSLAGCFFTNAEGRTAMGFMPDSTLNAQSVDAFGEEKKKVPISRNARHTAMVQRVGRDLIAQAQLHYGSYCKGFEWEVVLFEQPQTVNAYCMPGGKIGIFSGILPVCENEAALAAVMGHEIAHALLRHGNERVSQQLGFVACITCVGIGLNQTSLSSDAKKIVLAGAGLGGQYGLILPFSRSHESEADVMGLKLMARAGYDPAEAPHLWRRMQQHGGGGPPEFLSTHPSHETRIADLESRQSEVAPLYQASPQRGLGDKF